MNTQEHILFFDDFRVLYGSNFTNIIPRPDDSAITKANATMRFVIIVTILVTGIMRSISILAMIPLVGCLIGIYLHPSLGLSSTSNPQPSSNAHKNRVSTKDNPFMNYQIDQITTSENNKHLPDNFAENNHQARIDMETNFQLGVVDNENDIWGRKFASYQFYTIPNNSPIRDPNGAFQNWLYGRNYPTCKEDPRYCDVKPARTIDGGDGVMDRSLPFSIGLDINTKRRIAKGEMRSLQNIKAQ